MTITVGIPAYSRPVELGHLLESIAQQTILPTEVLVCEDRSPRRQEIRMVCEAYRQRFVGLGCCFRYVENEVNLGYDGNVRHVIGRSTSDYTMLMGDDDALYEDCIAEVNAYVAAHPGDLFISRSFKRFARDRSDVVNETWLSKTDRNFNRLNSTPNIIFRLCGFVGGLVVQTRWAQKQEVDTYDGTLYYQFYLCCLAYVDSGVGYISRPVVGGRTGNPPLFGASAAEESVHTPGSYSAKGRARMWASLMRIASDVESSSGVRIAGSLKDEIAGRQSFHIFEGVANGGRKPAVALLTELAKVGLAGSIAPWLLTVFIVIFGRHARYGFLAIRRLQYGVESRFGLKL